MTIIVTSKIQPHHTKRLAYIYIRQSSLNQVKYNWGSADVQRAMREHAIALGFHPENIIIIDEDQARSAKTIEGRDGFQRMLVDIVAGRVGAVFCSHSSRLVRSFVDSHQLYICCRITGTLIIDPDGIFDLQNDADNIHWGFKGVMDQADLLRIKSILMTGKVAKARKGLLRITLPTGLIWSNSDAEAKITLEPDERVRRAIHTAFDLLEPCGSALSVVRHFNENGLLFPSKIYSGPRKGDYEWKPLNEPRLLYLYHNPSYAGSYVFGRRSYQQKVHLDGRAVVQTIQVKVEPENWTVHIKNFHQGYITFEQYEANIRRLKENQYHFGKGSNGAVRSGHALLQGIALCGKCQCRMQVSYPSGRKYFFYDCRVRYSMLGQDRCQNVSALCVDELVIKQLFQAFEPMYMEISLEASRRVEASEREIVVEVERSLTKAQEAADYAEYRYLQVDPKNKEVAERLEELFSEKLLEVNRLKERCAEIMKRVPCQLESKEHEAILALAKDFSAIWNSDKMTDKIRKQIIRSVIDKVDIERDGTIVRVQIHWKTGISTSSYATLKTTGDRNRTDSKVTDIIRKMALSHMDKEIAQHLNELGLKSRRNQVFSKSIVQSLRDHHNIPTRCPERPSRKSKLENGQRSDGRYTTAEAARLFGVQQPTVSAWCKRGLLDGIRITATGAWWVKITKENFETVKKFGGLIPNKSHTGKLRAERLTARQLSDIGKKAAAARWSKKKEAELASHSI